MTQQTDARILATVIDALADPDRKAAILRAATAAPVGFRPGTVQQVADILQTCTRTAERYARAGCFPRVKLSPRKIRYDLGAVERFAASGIPASPGAA